MEKIDHIADLCLEAVQLKLDCRDVLQFFLLKELCVIYNGCGPEWLPESAREILTQFAALFEPVILIHDVQFFESDGTLKGFKKTVRTFRRNCRKVIAAKYPLMTWRILKPSYFMARLKARGVATTLYAAISSVVAYKTWQAEAKK